MELDSNYTFIVINNEFFIINNKKIRLRTLNIVKTSSVNYIDFRTALSLLQIYNPEQKLLIFAHYEDSLKSFGWNSFKYETKFRFIFL